MKPFLLPIFAFLVSTCAFAQQVLVKAELLVDHSQIKADESFEVGIKLRIEEGWHVYWKYPGDAGLPIRVKWNLPEGSKVSDLRWPVPKRFMQPGEIEGIGYEKEVMLLATIMPPAGFAGELPIEATVSWLACKETCIPGKAKVTASVRSGVSRQEHEQEFTTWRKRLPGNDPEAKVSIQRNGFTYTITLDLGQPAKQPDIFIALPAAFHLEQRRVEHTPRGLQAQIQLKFLPGAMWKPAPIEAVLTWRDDGNQPHSQLLNLPTE